MNDKLTSNIVNREYYAMLNLLFKKPMDPKLGLERITKLLDLIGIDRSILRIIQAVGTNGKGSTVAFIESILQKHGISTGLFTSPHLCSIRERIRINGRMVSEDDFIRAAQVVLKKAQNMGETVSFFENILAMAMWLFQYHQVKVAILEAGIGGRLDATTATKPDILGISMIDLDHQNILGNSLLEIATEKINAARAHQTVITVKQVNEAKEAILKAQKLIGFNLIEAPLCNDPLGLYGEHQKVNAGLSIALIKALNIPTSIDKTRQGLLDVQWPGRFEVIKGLTNVVIDGAHNPSGILALIECLKTHPLFSQKPLIMVYGSLKSQNALNKAKLLLKSSLLIKEIFLHQPHNPRAMPCSELKSTYLSLGFAADRLHEYQDWQEVIKLAKKYSAQIVICGSLYTAGALRSILLSIDMDPMMPNF